MNVRTSGMLAVLLVASLAACTSAPQPTLEPTNSPAPSDGIPGLPAECQAGALRSPSGEVVDLTGEWDGPGSMLGDAEVVVLKQLGSCLHGSIQAEDGGIHEIANLSGPMLRDFTIDLELVIIQQESQFKFGDYSTLVMLIEWDSAGRIRLREDREPDEVAGRCIQDIFECPPPVIWYRLADGPPPT